MSENGRSRARIRGESVLLRYDLTKLSDYAVYTHSGMVYSCHPPRRAQDACYKSPVIPSFLFFYRLATHFVSTALDGRAQAQRKRTLTATETSSTFHSRRLAHRQAKKRELGLFACRRVFCRDLCFAFSFFLTLHVDIFAF